MNTAFLEACVGDSRCRSVWLTYVGSWILQSLKDVVSVDLGTCNSAFAHVDTNLRIHSWGKLPLHMPKPYSPEKCYEEVSLFTADSMVNQSWSYSCCMFAVQHVVNHSMLTKTNEPRMCTGWLQWHFCEVSKPTWSGNMVHVGDL